MVEMIVAIILLAIVGGLIHGMLTASRRAYQRQVQLADVNTTLRATLSILEPTLRELNAGDAAGSDIVAMNSTSMTFKTSRNLYFLCQAPDVVNSAIMVGQDPGLGQQGFNGLDSLFLFFEGDPEIRADDRWLHAGVLSVTAGTACPAAAPSYQIMLGGIASVALDSVYLGAPVRGFDVTELGLYVESGERWLGSRTFSGGTWSTQEMLVGPMAVGGLEFFYFDAAGNTTTVAGNVARVALFVTGRTARMVSTGTSQLERATAELTTDIALRNNPWF